MKIGICITKVECVREAGWPASHEKLEISGDGITFRVADTKQARKTYVVGRYLSVTIAPGAVS